MILGIKFCHWEAIFFILFCLSHDTSRPSPSSQAKVRWERLPPSSRLPTNGIPDFSRLADERQLSVCWLSDEQICLLPLSDQHWRLSFHMIAYSFSWRLRNQRIENLKKRRQKVVNHHPTRSFLGAVASDSIVLLLFLLQNNEKCPACWLLYVLAHLLFRIDQGNYFIPPLLLWSAEWKKRGFSLHPPLVWTKLTLYYLMY